MTVTPYQNKANQDIEVSVSGLKKLLPTTIYTPFIFVLILLSLSICVTDAKGIPILLGVLMYAASVRIGLTRRAEQRRTNQLLMNLLDGDNLDELEFQE